MNVKVRMSRFYSFNARTLPNVCKHVHMYVCMVCLFTVVCLTHKLSSSILGNFTGFNFCTSRHHKPFLHWFWISLPLICSPFRAPLVHLFIYLFITRNVLRGIFCVLKQCTSAAIHTHTQHNSIVWNMCNFELSNKNVELLCLEGCHLFQNSTKLTL